MARLIFITGGARSGKSSFAESRTREFGTPLGYLATAQALDNEMLERVRGHCERRGAEWHTIEEPLCLAHALECCDDQYNAILVDCVTLWLSNLFFKYEDTVETIEVLVLEELQHLKCALSGMKTPVILVSNEVGMGIVPENALARRFRDIAGMANQILAATADEVHVVISGIPLQLK
ncbi:MAG: bifunctional adenosylcobinamide kinase/adenosylcobinamide-phosphate guanylyltransferase [Desulfuromonadaceae bacterium]|nr:bifunctional adenosylcobinamide kinase/adenosylcobinamide-phosphate guanylyltransferase [Desulfuromonadaceae bacterium]MDD5104715.1 bifunctional adenosylcobinamide kinase/adenosylcobinamide-phosphate guanylyltransferase [Desulfuromonadaceae bacterium]